MQRKLTIRIVIMICLFMLTNNSLIVYSAPSHTILQKYYQQQKNLQYPYLTNAPNNKAQNKINQALKKHIIQSNKEYEELKKLEESIKNDPHCKESNPTCDYEYLTTYKVLYDDNNQLSIIFYDYRFTGGAHGSTLVTTYNFDVKSGEQYTLNDFIKHEKKYDEVTNFIKEYAKKHPEIFYSDIEDWKDFTVSSTTNFYLAKDGIYLIFQQYEVGPYVSGTPTVFIPKSVYQ
ncbi:DUF3298 and DUF4163 domain-containing protein [Bacillus sp. B1-b2]|uniref:DUF3298 and DUF4163 domain-containing protein n=1 Tax=Bacillus sp. B1-b2 TaxID=2653201 RepID=UPI0012621778|nr:DUF3298 and DUF4163 domain-containing protein [Bacillus sp. B1-b2]KAB7673073.1 DUF3298 and DUF4163 domain-containing protein [Bacillus sp. B1-b2]